jgi:hypothetical protein
MIKLTLTDDEAQTVVNCLYTLLDRATIKDKNYNTISLTYHTIYDMVRQQRKANA